MLETQDFFQQVDAKSLSEYPETAKQSESQEEVGIDITLTPTPRDGHLKKKPESKNYTKTSALKETIE